MQFEEIWNDKDLIVEAVRVSKSKRNTLVNLGIEPSSKRYKKLQEQCDLFGITLSFENPRAATNRTSDSDVFKNPSVFNRNNGKELKVRALALGYVENICKLCGIAETWNDKPLILQLDHIDGDWMNNLPDNLRMLCPNCHSQTDTFTYRNRKQKFCINGHDWIPENLRRRKEGNVCILCAETYNKKSRDKERKMKGWSKDV